MFLKVSFFCTTTIPFIYFSIVVKDWVLKLCLFYIHKKPHIPGFHCHNVQENVCCETLTFADICLGLMMNEWIYVSSMDWWWMSEYIFLLWSNTWSGPMILLMFGTQSCWMFFCLHVFSLVLWDGISRIHVVLLKELLFS